MTPPPGEGMWSLDGRVAVVTGGADGMGREIAIGLARAGASVAVADIDDKRTSDVVEAIVTEGSAAIAVHCDVSSSEQVDGLFSRVDRELGGVDILVNNAGINVVSAPAEQYPEGGWEQTLRINLTGPFLCSRAAGRRMIQAGRGGSIINISSISGATAANRQSLAFGAAKAGLNQLTKDLAVEWAPYRVRVNAILPCQFRTRGWAAIIEDPANDLLVQTVLRGIPLGRMGEPEDIVGPVWFLASSASSMITGTLIPVDGGNLAMNAGAGGAWPSSRS